MIWQELIYFARISISNWRRLSFFLEILTTIYAYSADWLKGYKPKLTLITATATMPITNEKLIL